jgi:hypothetical protein
MCCPYASEIGTDSIRWAQWCDPEKYKLDISNTVDPIMNPDGRCRLLGHCCDELDGLTWCPIKKQCLLKAEHCASVDETYCPVLLKCIPNTQDCCPTG